MPDRIPFTPQTAAVLRALLGDPAARRWGTDLSQETGLRSGTLHPILARLERAGLVCSEWESPASHEGKGRPRRRYYRLCDGSVEEVRRAVAAPAPCPTGGPAV